MLLVAIVVDIIAGIRGGPNRVAGLIGGLLLLSTPVGFMVAIFGTALPAGI